MVERAVEITMGVAESLNVDYPSMDFHAFSGCEGLDPNSGFGQHLLENAKKDFIRQNSLYIQEMIQDEEEYHEKIREAVQNYGSLSKESTRYSIDEYIKKYCKEVANNCADEFVERDLEISIEKFEARTAGYE